MPLSSFQQPSTRRDSLECLIEAAVSDGDLHRLNVLRSQWVHRYCLASLPALALSEPSPKSSETTPVALESVEPVASLQDYRAQQESNELDPEELVPVVAPPQDAPSWPASHESDALSCDTAPDGDDAVQNEWKEAHPLSIDLDDQITSAVPKPSSLRAATPPPLCTPRSLRRWLPGADSALPQAS